MAEAWGSAHHGLRPRPSQNCLSSLCAPEPPRLLQGGQKNPRGENAWDDLGVPGELGMQTRSLRPEDRRKGQGDPGCP
jgi:hypothetical protein